MIMSAKAILEKKKTAVQNVPINFFRSVVPNLGYVRSIERKLKFIKKNILFLMIAGTQNLYFCVWGYTNRVREQNYVGNFCFR
jgi:hypothetical protein